MGRTQEMSRFLLLALALVIAFVSALPSDDATKHLDDHSAVDIVKKALKGKVGEELGCAAATCAAATSGTPAARSTCNLCNAAPLCKWQWNAKMEKAPLTTVARALLAMPPTSAPASARRPGSKEDMMRAGAWYRHGPGCSPRW